MRRRTLLLLLFILLLGVGTFWVAFGFGKPPSIDIGGYKNDLTLKQGLDLQGGIQIIMQAQCPADDQKCDKASRMDAVVRNINSRIQGGLAVSDAVVRRQGADR